MQKTNVQQ